MDKGPTLPQQQKISISSGRRVVCESFTRRQVRRGCATHVATPARQLNLERSICNLQGDGAASSAFEGLILGDRRQGQVEGASFRTPGGGGTLNPVRINNLRRSRRNIY